MRYAPLLALLLAGCSPKEYRCKADVECIAADGRFGLCLDTHCAYLDEACTGGFRFDDAAGDQAKMCVSAQEVGAHLDAGTRDGPIPADGPMPADAPASDAAASDAPVADAPTGG
jgi:hypothetical protein